jgi:hypothetical protein
VIEMDFEHKNEPEREVRTEPEREFRPMNPVRAVLLRIWGPADSWDNPLTGTKYDPGLRAERQHESLEWRRRRSLRRKQQWNRLIHRHHGAHR